MRQLIKIKNGKSNLKKKSVFEKLGYVGKIRDFSLKPRKFDTEMTFPLKIRHNNQLVEETASNNDKNSFSRFKFEVFLTNKKCT